MSDSERDKLPYSDRLDLIKLALQYEELEIEKSYKKYEIEDGQITKQIFAYNMYSFRVKKSDCPDRIKECMVCLVDMRIYNKDKVYNREEDRIFGFVENYEKGAVTFKKNGYIECSQFYHIKFIPSRTSYRACYETIEYIERRHNLTRFFQDFQSELEWQEEYEKEEIEITEWFNKTFETNVEQKQAVQSILNRTAFPFPFVVFGPPGTGKTSTLVEAVTQISKNRPTSKILITAQSNSACDEIATRLLKYIARKNIFRYYSPSALRNFKDLDPQIVSTSNLRGRRVHVPTYEEFYHFQIVIVTLVSSKYLQRAKIRSQHLHR
jgi:helicase MOV-10